MEKTFNLEAAKKGAVIKNEEGSIFKFIAHVPDADIDARVILMHNNNRGIFVFREDGSSYGCSKVHTEPLTITKYLRVYKDGCGDFDIDSRLYDSETEARLNMPSWHYIGKVTIEI